MPLFCAFAGSRGPLVSPIVFLLLLLAPPATAASTVPIELLIANADLRLKARDAWFRGDAGDLVAFQGAQLWQPGANGAAVLRTATQPASSRVACLSCRPQARASVEQESPRYSRRTTHARGRLPVPFSWTRSMTAASGRACPACHAWVQLSAYAACLTCDPSLVRPVVWRR